MEVHQKNYCTSEISLLPLGSLLKIDILDNISFRGWLDSVEDKTS